MANGSNSQLSEQTQASKVNNMGGSELSGLELPNKINRSSLFNTTQRKDTHESPFESHKNSREDKVIGTKFDNKGMSLNQTLASVNSLKHLNLNHDKRQSADLGFDQNNNNFNYGISIHLPTQGQGMMSPMMSPPYFATTAKQQKERSRINSNNILTDGGTYLQTQPNPQINQTSEIQNKTPRQFALADRYYNTQTKIRQAPLAQFKSQADYAGDIIQS